LVDQLQADISTNCLEFHLGKVVDNPVGVQLFARCRGDDGQREAAGGLGRFQALRSVLDHEAALWINAKSACRLQERFRMWLAIHDVIRGHQH
jgi:hypothetical protein